MSLFSASSSKIQHTGILLRQVLLAMGLLFIAFPFLHADEVAEKPDNDKTTDIPEVTIIKRQGRTIEQYRINNRIYMVKIIPSKGYPYYLVDSDGDGSLETKRDGLGAIPDINQWRIYRW